MRGKKKSPYLLRTFGIPEEEVKGYKYQKWIGGIDLYLDSEEEKKEAFQKFGEFVYAEDMVEMEEVVVRLLEKKGLKLATAESCTGGLLSARIVNVEGCSKVFLGGFVAYSNDLKMKLLGVEESLLEKFGAVSEEVCRAMCIGALEETDADISVAITGIAGPTGGTPQKPVGLTYIGIGTDREVIVKRYHLRGTRNENRFLATQIAFDMLRRFINGKDTPNGYSEP